MVHAQIIISQQTKNVVTMLIKCLASVEDDGPTLKHHWFNVSCFLGLGMSARREPLVFFDCFYTGFRCSLCVWSGRYTLFNNIHVVF